MTQTQIRILLVLAALVGLLAVFTVVVFALDPGDNDRPAARPTTAATPADGRAGLGTRTRTPVQSTPSPTPTTTPTPAGTATATATPARGGLVLRAPGAANIRGGPGTDFNVVATLQAGDEVAASGRNADGSWLLVTHAGGTGWVASDVVQVVSGAPSTLAVVPTPALPPRPVPTAAPAPPAPAPITPTAAPTPAQPPVPARTPAPAPAPGVLVTPTPPGAAVPPSAPLPAATPEAPPNPVTAPTLPPVPTVPATRPPTP